VIVDCAACDVVDADVVVESGMEDVVLRVVESVVVIDAEDEEELEVSDVLLETPVDNDTLWRLTNARAMSMSAAPTAQT